MTYYFLSPAEHICLSRDLKNPDTDALNKRLLLAAAYRRCGVLMHPSPVLFHRFEILEFLIADVALEGFCPACSKEPPHTL
jgi:hypothetical protein